MSILKLIWTTYLNTTSKGIDFRSFPKVCLTRAPLCTSWTRHTSTHLHHQKGKKAGNISINSIIQIIYRIMCKYLCKRSSGREEDRACRLLHAWRQMFTSSRRAELRSWKKKKKLFLLELDNLCITLVVVEHLKTFLQHSL